MTQLATATPIEARVIERRPDGSALIEVPVISVTPKLDLSKTHGGGKGSISISAADLVKMAENFAVWTKPVAVGFDGLGGHQDARGGPQSVFINSLRVEGDTLMAALDLNPFAASMVLDDRAFRGFSMEASRNPRTPTKSFEGWVLTGGVFTNNPATDTQFKIAATGDTEADETMTVTASFNAPPSDRARAKETEMADETVKLAQVEADLTLAIKAKEEAEAKLATAEDRVTASVTKLSAALTKVDDLDTRLTTETAKATKAGGEVVGLNARIETLERDVAKYSGELTAQKDADRSKEILALSQSAVEAGVAASFFDGVEKNPLDWFKSKGLTDVSALTALIDALPKAETVSATSSGTAPKPTDDSAEGLTDAGKATLVRLGLDPKYAGVDSEEDLVALEVSTDTK